MSNAKSGSKFSTIKWILILVVVAIAALLIQNTIAHRVSAVVVPQDAATAQAIEDRIKPLGEVSIAPTVHPVAIVSAAASVSEVAPVSEAAGPAKGDAVSASKVGQNTYNAVCTGCHSTGALGAPKLGDKAAWAPRIAQGMQVLYNSALKGKKSMPAKGGNASLSEADVTATVDYIVAASR